MSLLLICAVVIIAVIFIISGIRYSVKAPMAISISSSGELKRQKKSQLQIILKSIFPFSRVILEKLNLYPGIKLKLDGAHLRLAPEEFFNLKILLIVAAIFLLPILFGSLDPVKLIIGLAVAYIAPEIWLNNKIKQRKEAVRIYLPETVDLLGLCVEAGLDFTTAIEWIIRKGITKNTMIDELAFILEEIHWGKPRMQALKDMSKRLDIPEVNSFVQTLIQAEKMGTPVSEAFGILSEDARLQRFHRGERYAMKAPIKILLPLIFCILPVIGIIIGGPIFLQFVQEGMFKNF